MRITLVSLAALVPLSAALELPRAIGGLAASYASSMRARPIITKAATSAAIFGARAAAWEGAAATRSSVRVVDVRRAEPERIGSSQFGI